VQSYDFQRSTFTFRSDQLKKPSTTRSEPARFSLNNARIPIDCVADVHHVSSGTCERYLLGGNCKTERQAPVPPQSIWTRVDDGLNADFVPIMGETRGMHIKTYDRRGKTTVLAQDTKAAGTTQPDRQVFDPLEAFDSVTRVLTTCAAEELSAAVDLVGAVLGNDVLVGETSWETSDGSYAVTITYPIRTVNCNERDCMFQPDTGPVLCFPTLSGSVEPEDVLGETAEMAFLAWHNGDGGGGPTAVIKETAEFLIRQPTVIAADDGVGSAVEVYHYSKVMKVVATNRVFRTSPAARQRGRL
jgi:hypothetical protein